MITTLRNADWSDLMTVLQSQNARKLDLVAPSSALSMTDGVLRVSGAEPILDTDGVTEVDGDFVPTSVFDEGVSDKLGIPLPYLRRLRRERPDLLDANVNGWLHGTLSPHVEDYSHFARRCLVRLFRADDSPHGIARAFLSDAYKVIDNFDVLMACLAGVKETGINATPAKGDLSERRMTVFIEAPEISVAAHALTKGYKSPYTGQSGDECPLVSAYLRIGNSETGGGAYSLAPGVRIKVCDNGLIIPMDVMRNVHLGGRLEEGVVDWSEQTQAKALELITAKTTDAVRTFLSTEYLQRKVEEMEEVAGVRIKASEAPEVIARVGKALFDADTTKAVLDFFMDGEQRSAAGVMNAITAYVQTVEDPDRAYDISNQAYRGMQLAASIAGG